MTRLLLSLAAACALAAPVALAAPQASAGGAASAVSAPAAPASAPQLVANATTSTVPQPATPANPVQLVPATTGAAVAGAGLVQTIFALLVVLAALAALAWFLKRFGPGQASGQGNLHIVGALSLGGRERIVVVEVGEQWIVVGASPGRINALATLPRQEGVPPVAATPAQPFADWLKKTLDKRHNAE